MKKLITIALLSLIITGCRQFQQEQTNGTVNSQNGQFKVDYQLSYSTGNGYGSDTPQRLENEIRNAFSSYRWGYTNRISRNANFEVKYTEALVRLINFSMNVWDTNGKTYSTISREYGVFDFEEAVQKAHEFFQTHGYILTGGTRLDREGAAYVEFTITDDLIDKIYINARGRDGWDGTCRCYSDPRGDRYCRGTPGENGEDGGDVLIKYPSHLRDRLQLLEIHNEGGLGGRGGICTDGYHGPDGYNGRNGQIFYQEF